MTGEDRRPVCLGINWGDTGEMQHLSPATLASVSSNSSQPIREKQEGVWLVFLFCFVYFVLFCLLTSYSLVHS